MLHGIAQSLPPDHILFKKRDVKYLSDRCPPFFRDKVDTLSRKKTRIKLLDLTAHTVSQSADIAIHQLIYIPTAENGQ